MCVYERERVCSVSVSMYVFVCERECVCLCVVNVCVYECVYVCVYECTASAPTLASVVHHLLFIWSRECRSAVRY